MAVEFFPQPCWVNSPAVPAPMILVSGWHFCWRVGSSCWRGWELEAKVQMSLGIWPWSCSSICLSRVEATVWGSPLALAVAILVVIVFSVCRGNIRFWIEGDYIRSWVICQ